MPVALRVIDLWKCYAAGVAGCSARVWALRGCSLELAVGERVAVVGARGAGKTTLLHCLAGERRPDAGRIEHLVPVYWHRRSDADLEPRRVRASTSLVLLIDDVSDTAPLVEFGTTAIVTSRDMARVNGLVDRVLLLEDGRLTPMTRTVVRRVAERSSATRSGTILR